MNPGRADRVSRWLTLATFAVACAAFVAAPFLALSWSGKPFPGFLVEPTLVVANYDGEGWSGRSAGLDFPQRLTDWNDRALTTLAAYDSAVSATATGARVAIRSVSPNGTTHSYPAIELRSFPSKDLVRLFWVPYSVGLLYLLIGAWVYRMRGHTRPARAFAFFCVSTSVATGLLFDLMTTHVGAALWIAAIAQEGSALISLAWLFPQEWPPVQRRAWLRFLPYGISIPLAVWALLSLADRSDPWAYIGAWRVIYAYAALGIGIFLITMVFRQRTSLSMIARQQARIILWGSVFAFGPIGAWMAAPLFGVSTGFNTLLFLPLLLVFPLCIALAILRYRLWDIDVIVNRTLVYGALTGLLAIVYVASVVALQQILGFLAVFGPPPQGVPRDSSHLAVAASTLTTAALFYPLRRLVQTFIDRRFYRQKYNAAQTLAAFKATLRDEVDLTRLTERVEAVIWDTLQPAHIFTWLGTPTGFRLFVQEEPLAGQAGAEVSLDDPIVDVFRSASGVIELERLDLDSPALHRLQSSEVQIVVPFVSQAELFGWLSLGPSMGGQAYSADDRALLADLGAQAGPAVRVAQLVRQQQAQALERERLAHELQLARLIQQTLLPKELPKLPGWELAVHYQPARAVGGDFYDFMVLPDGRLFLTVGDVTDKGMPAALVMASIRAILRGNARRSLLPSAALQRANELLHPEIPAYMFVTCLYALLDPSTGRLQYANAGHNLPYRKRNGAVSELQATGMPLGLMPGVRYEEQETTLAPGECLVFYSDGLVEAHGPAQDMFGFPRLQQLVGQNPDGGPGLIRSLLTELESFTGPGWEQEDDVTVLTLQRSDVPESTDEEARKNANMQIDKWPVLLEFVVSSEAGNERIAMDRVAEAAAAYFAQEPLERLKTAVAEAVLNGIEHGNQYQAELPVQVQLLLSPAEDALAVRVTDRGIAAPIPEQTSPDLDAKLAELDTPRGWGLFLIRSMVDEMHVFNDETEHRLELILYR